MGRRRPTQRDLYGLQDVTAEAEAGLGHIQDEARFAFRGNVVAGSALHPPIHQADLRREEGDRAKAGPASVLGREIVHAHRV